jgi:threonine dehydrogenase-like Zn-dependent dehydrogenase
MGAFISMPLQLGHEILARIIEVGPKVSRVKVGARVVVEPFLTCIPRGIDPPCRNCARGDYSACEGLNGGTLPPGTGIGSNNYTGGGWGERVVAHEESCFVVPDEMSDDDAVLLEPFSCAIHGVSRRFPADNETVMVYGSGAMGILSITALRALGSKARILSVARHGYQAALAKEAGADVVLTSRGKALFEAVAAETGARMYKSKFGNTYMLMGGVDVVYDAVGSTETITNSLRFARGRGTVVLIGMGGPRKVDWTPVWFQEVTIMGSMGHATVNYRGERIKAFDLAQRLVSEKGVKLSRFVTHKFKLDDWKDAVRAFVHKDKSKAVKVVIVP